jgi:hypothetical protein
MGTPVASSLTVPARDAWGDWIASNSTRWSTGVTAGCVRRTYQRAGLDVRALAEGLHPPDEIQLRSR